ncbi:MAG: hemerythrin domain-containing protein [Deltaproteobacteria bacterium]|nr:hemerythrin domain-containing protein [Deltaproteobacteria bacterium]
MTPTDYLQLDHQLIKRMVTVIKAISQRLDNQEHPPAEALLQVVSFIREFADHSHHGKEEEILFPALEAAGIPRVGGPVGVMLMEHEQGRLAAQAMAQAAQQYANPGDGQAGREFSAAAKAYCGVLEGHIFKEDNILYAIADKALTAEQQGDLLTRMKTLDSERLSQPYSHYEMMVDELEKTCCS